MVTDPRHGTPAQILEGSGVIWTVDGWEHPVYGDIQPPEWIMTGQIVHPTAAAADASDTLVVQTDNDEHEWEVNHNGTFPASWKPATVVVSYRWTQAAGQTFIPHGSRTAFAFSVAVPSEWVPDLTQQADAKDFADYDPLLRTEKDLKAIDETIRGLIEGKAVLSYSISGRFLSRYSLGELRGLRDQYAVRLKKLRRSRGLPVRPDVVQIVPEVL